MEPLTWVLLAETIRAGIVANRVDAGFAKACAAGWQRAIQDLNAPDLQSTQNELALAMNRAFLWAQQSLVQECLAEFSRDVDGGFSLPNALPGREADVSWLIGKDRQLKDDLKQLNKGQLSPLPEQDLAALEGLLQQQNLGQHIQDQLVAVIQQEDAPDCYAKRAYESGTGLLARVAAFFEFELKTNQPVRDWFQTGLLLQINRRLQAEPVKLQALELQTFQDRLRELARQLPEVLGRLDNLALAVDELGQDVSEVRLLVMARADELVALVLRNADDLAVLKRLLGEVLIELRQRGAPVIALPTILVSQPREGPNPFIYGPAVPPNKFYGRRQQKADIKNRIGGVEPQSINIVGLRRNGKSSMLRYVKERIGEFCLAEQQPLVVLLDLQDQRFHTPEGILEGLRRGIRKQTGREPWARETNDDPFELEDSLEALRDKGYRLIVMFDEFGAIGQRLEKFQDWGDDWRSKASRSLVTLVIASRRSVSEIYSTLGLGTSVKIRYR